MFKVGDLVRLKQGTYNGAFADDVGIVVKIIKSTSKISIRQGCYVFVFNAGCEFLFYDTQMEIVNDV